MRTIRTKIDTLLYGYNPREFLPVFYDGKLSNKSEYIRYKLTRGFVRFSDAFDRFHDRTTRY